MTVIEVRGLVKRFGPATVVDGLSFTVGTGTVAGFLGPNRAGKTTTLRMLLGLVRPTRGQAMIWGKPYRDLGEQRHRVGAVLEASGFHPGRTVAIISGSGAPRRVPGGPGSARCSRRPG
jgi:ABC-2 type transport system ATP-binding protein